MSGRTMLALGGVIAVAVMVGMVGASALIGTALTARRPAATPTVGYIEPMTPLPGRIDVLGAGGQPMTADKDGGETFFLPNGTTVQITLTDPPLARVQVMDGQHRHRVGWLPVNAISH